MILYTSVSVHACHSNLDKSTRYTRFLCNDSSVVLKYVLLLLRVLRVTFAPVLEEVAYDKTSFRVDIYEWKDGCRPIHVCS